MYNSNIRTDLALEVRESFEEDNVEIKGVELYEEKEKELKVTTVIIKDENGAKEMQKPIGTYITIESDKLKEEDDSYYEPVSKKVEEIIKKLLKEHKDKGVLIAGLGNRGITPDSLGPLVVDNLFVTRHLIREFGEEFAKENKIKQMCAIAPGVMGQTGMETREILRGIIKETKPSCLIVIDALAARSIERLNTTIQITDTGISPGAGVGNNRTALNKESIGIDVIAIGVPTVVDAKTIVSDTMETFLKGKEFSQEEIRQFIAEIGEKSVKNLFVTPKGIDESIKKVSYTISEALNSCFCVNS